MATTEYGDELLMAFADGLLDDEESAKIEEAVAADPALALRVAGLAEARLAVKELHGSLLDMPVPDDLKARVEAMAASRNAAPASAGAEVVNLSERRGRRGWMARVVPAVLAASVAAMIAGPIGFMMAPANAPAFGVGGALPAGVAAVLGNVPSGQTQDVAGIGSVETIATFRDAGGTLCREFEVDTATALVAVACRTEAEWRITFAVEAPLTEGYAPAGALEALDAYLGAVSAGEPMSAEEEAKALSGN